MRLKEGFLVVLLAFLSSRPAAAQYDPVNDLDQCYQLDWSYDSPDFWDGTRSWNDGFNDPWNNGFLLWYCQARPLEAAEFSFPRYQAYMSDRDFARDHALMRCERDAERCVTRCALAPRICRPHFWP